MLPQEGEITSLDSVDRAKIAALGRVLRVARRDDVYAVKVIDIPQAAMGLHARAVLFVSKPALDLLRPEELEALAAHEIGHEYVWSEYERATRGGDHERVKQLELLCDGIAAILLRRLDRDVSRLITALEKISRFNRERFGRALNESSYPTIEKRRSFIRAMEVR